MGQTWGNKFLEQYGPEPNDAWIAFLSGMTVDASKSAFRDLVLEGSGFPPTLPEFVAIARKHRALSVVRFDANGRQISG
jgi:hypothetical protein